MVTHRKGNEYRYYTCSEKCGAGTVRIEEVDSAAIKYLKELLSSENQERIAASLHEYQNSQKDRNAEFNAALRHKINERKSAYDNLLKNLFSGVLLPEVVSDMGSKMQELKAEIQVLEQITPPTDYIHT